jgi:uncharacterized protein YbjT (DUF2867 family)
VAQRLIVRDPKRAPKLPGAEVAQVGAFGDAVGMGRALKGIDKLFLVSAHDRFGVNHHAILKNQAPPPYDRLREQLTAVDVAAAVGVKHLVCLTVINAYEDSVFVLAKDHYLTEQHVKALGVPYTFVRMSLYIDHIPMFCSADGVIRAPAGETRGNWVARDDLADVIVAVLTGKGHEGQAYDTTGPEALTLYQVADQLTKVVGRKITYQMQTPHEARTTRSTSGLEHFEAERKAATGGTGLSDWEVEVFVSHFMQFAVGDMAKITDTVPRLTGHKAMSLVDFLHAYPESWQHLVVK